MSISARAVNYIAYFAMRRPSANSVLFQKVNLTLKGNEVRRRVIGHIVNSLNNQINPMLQGASKIQSL